MRLSRRSFLQMSGLLAAYGALPPLLGACRVPSETVAHPDMWADEPTIQPAASNATDPALLHLVQRLTYGATAAELARATELGFDGYLDEQLNPDQIDDSDLERRLSSFTTLGLSSAELFTQYPVRGTPGPQAIIKELEQASLLRAVYSRRQLQEVMVDFWSNHFNIYIGKGIVRWLKTADDREVMRPYALGSFPELLLASAKSPAMLVYLDNVRSTVRVGPRGNGGVNENYARELMELHTIGADAGYDHDDIVAVARALTGWSVGGLRNTNTDQPTGFMFRPRLHDNDEKRINVLDLTLPAGGGIADGETLLAHLAADPRTAQRIARKLCIRFMEDDPPQSIVDQTAQTFLTSKGDIRATLSAVFRSAEFKAAAGQKIKLPTHALASMLRSTAAQTGVEPQLLQHLRLLGQAFFAWPAPNGYPQVGAAWVTTSGMLARWNAAFALAEGRIRGTTIELPKLTALANVPTHPTPAQLVDGIADALLHGRLPAAARTTLVNYVSNGGSPTAPLDQEAVNARLPELAGLLLASPLFQVF